MTQTDYRLNEAGFNEVRACFYPAKTEKKQTTYEAHKYTLKMTQTYRLNEADFNRIRRYCDSAKTKKKQS
jgi:hypothetical protein